MAHPAHIKPQICDLNSTVGQSTRPRIEAAVERLLALLDELDGDPDMEPSLGSPERSTVLLTWSGVDHGSSQLDWGGRPRAAELVDLEDEHDGSEPSLGWTITGALGSDTELELDRSDDEPDDTGIADIGGLAEQVGRSRYDRGVL